MIECQQLAPLLASKSKMSAMENKLLFKSASIVLCCYLAATFIFAAETTAEDSGGRADVLVQIRTIQASGMLRPGALSDTAEARLKNASLSIDSRIEDIAHKLEKLHYQSYRLIGSHDKIVPVRRRETINLSSGHTLSVRCLYVKDQRVGMWIKWRDGNGMEVLDTRMHFDSGESMITGTDGHSDTGIILAINATAVAK